MFWRRTAEIALIDSDDTECIEAKNNLYKQENGNWVANTDLLHRQMSNNTILYTKKPTREQWHQHITKMRYSGEPGFGNLEAIKRRRPEAEGLNPCLTGDMEILTADGYQPLWKLAGKTVKLINKNGDAVNGKVWYTGEKEIYQLFRSDGKIIKCTADHRFVDKFDNEIEAKDTAGKWLKAYRGAMVKINYVENTGKKESVYDFSEPETHWGVVENLITHNCGEILLSNKQNCNLTTVNMMAYAHDGKVDKEALKDAFKRSFRAGYRMTNVDLELHEWSKNLHKDRLTGVSPTGWEDMINATGMTTEEEANLADELWEAVEDANDEYAAETGLNKSVCTTTIKPSGCWTKEYTRVTEQGIFFIDELKDAEEGSGWHDTESSYTANSEKITKVFANKKKPLVEITLQNNRKIKVTPEHPLSVNGEWIEAKNLRLNQQLDYKLGTYKNEVHSDLIPVPQETIDAWRSDIHLTDLPKKMDEELAWLIGAYMANGCFTTNNRIKYSTNHLDVIERVQDIWSKRFRIKKGISEYNDREAYNIEFRSNLIYEWFKINGINKDAMSRVPLVIRKSSYKDILAFITGYADNDGCFHNKSFSIDSCDSVFIRHLQEVAEAVGISFGYSENIQRENTFSKKPMYKLALSRTFSLPSVINYINDYSTKAKKSPLINTDNVHNLNPYIVKGIKRIQSDYTYDIEVQNTHWYYQGALKSHNTLSLLPDVSAGIHYPHSEYFIRRVRISSTDPLVKVAEELGWNVKPEVGQTEENCNTKVIEFPCKSPNGKTKYDVTAIEQLENYKRLMDNYVTHNVSITVSVREHEWEAVENWVWQHWDEVVAVSFLPLTDAFYELAPYEEIDKETYEKMSSAMKKFIPSLINKYEREQYEHELENDPDCSTGACPVR